MIDQILIAIGTLVLVVLWTFIELWPAIDTDRDRRKRQKEMD
jgi:hypothetical protein